MSQTTPPDPSPNTCPTQNPYAPPETGEPVKGPSRSQQLQNALALLAIVGFGVLVTWTGGRAGLALAMFTIGFPLVFVGIRLAHRTWNR